MYANLQNQLLIFAIFVLLGLNFGVYYDFFKSFRLIFSLKILGSFITDILFWLITTAHFFIFLINFSLSEVRFYVLFAILFGFFVYFYTLSKFFLFFFTFILNLLKSPFQKIYKLLMIFLKKVFIFYKK